MKLPPGYVPGGGVRKPSTSGGFGETLLKRLGWKEGQGLGIEGQGISSFIKVHKKEDASGVGQRQSNRELGKGWWEQAYDSAIRSVEEQTNTPSSDSSSDEGDEDRGVRHNRDGTLASGTKEELRLAQRLAKDPWGRFGGRAGKLERIRRQEAAMATAKLESLPVELKQRQLVIEEAQEASCPGLDAHAAQNLAATAAQESLAMNEELEQKPARKKTKKRPRVEEHMNDPQERLHSSEPPAVHSSSMPQPKAEVLQGAADTPSTPAAWWGASNFVSRGCLEGLERDPQLKRSAAFTEDTQADLYTKTQAAKTAGKTGLGCGKGKELGSAWQGKKTIFTDSEEHNGENGCAATQPSGKICLEEEEPVPTAVKAALEVPIVKWKALCKQILDKEPGRQMRLRKLAKHVAAQLQKPAEIEMVQKTLVAKVGKSAKFAVGSKTIRLL